MIEIPDFSRELCGGTHIQSTAQIGLFKIVSESGSSSGVRRIEAVTGEAALQHVRRAEETLEQASALLRSSSDLLTALQRTLARQRELEQEVRRLQAGSTAHTDLPEPHTTAGIAILTAELPDASADALANRADSAAQKLKSGIVVLASVKEGKLSFVARVTPDLVEKGLHAGNLLREAARITGGGGGGRADFATAGGKNPERLAEALKAVDQLAEQQLNARG